MPSNIAPAAMKGRRRALTELPSPSMGVQRRPRSWATRLSLAWLFALVDVGVFSVPPLAASKPPPNILLIVMDDIGIDQWQLFGYGGTTAAAMPNITSIAKARIKFGN